MTDPTPPACLFCGTPETNILSSVTVEGDEALFLGNSVKGSTTAIYTMCLVCVKEQLAPVAKAKMMELMTAHRLKQQHV